MILRSWKLALCLLVWLSEVAANLRNVQVLCQQELILDSRLQSFDLPMSAILYISAGANATSNPPITIRIAELPPQNNSAVVYIQHLSNFTLPEILNAPNNIRYGILTVGDIEEATWPNARFMNYTPTTNGSSTTAIGGSGILYDALNNITVVANGNSTEIMSSSSASNVQVDSPNLVLALINQIQISAAPQFSTFHDWVGFSNTAKNVLGRVSSGINLIQAVSLKPKPGTPYAGQTVAFTSQSQTNTTSSLRRRDSGNAVNQIVQSANALTDMKDPLISASALSVTDNPASLKGATLVPVNAICARSLDSLMGDSSSLEKRCLVKSIFGGGNFLMTRQGGFLATVTGVDPRILRVAGIAMGLHGLAFIILDFLHGQWLSASFGLAGSVLGLALTFFALGAIEWLIGGFVSFLFAILPTIFRHQATMPSSNSAVEAVRWKFFGDASHTGNEKCQKDNPGCVASYGPGVLALTFGWEYFDAIVFMLVNNQGLTMTIPDIAASFKIYSFDKDINATAPAYVISCQNDPNSKFRIGLHQNYWSNGDPKQCKNATMRFDRGKIMVPGFNQTASQLYDRIIPTPGGDCKLVNNADNPVTMPQYNLTITGFPVGIVCGNDSFLSPNATILTGSPIAPAGSIYYDNGTLASGNHSGTSAMPSSATATLPSNNTTNTTDSNLFGPVPPPKIFATPLNISNSACFNGATGSACLPNGTYTLQKGSFGFNTLHCSTVVFPQGQAIQIRDKSNQPPIKWTTNQTDPSRLDFPSAMTTLSDPQNGWVFDVVISPSLAPPVACYYTQTKFQGDVTCLGLGGGNLTTAGRGQIQSVRVMGGAGTILYPDFYGSNAGYEVTASISDLTSAPLGTGGNFSKKTQAVLIAMLQGETATT